MSAPKSGPVLASYCTRDEAAVAGYRWILKKIQDWTSREYNFYVWRASYDKLWHYSTPVGGTANSSDLKVPTYAGGYCHTHPAHSGPNFSSQDREQFLAASRFIPGIVFYLMDPMQQLHVARQACDFMAGQDLSWLKVDP